MSPRATFVAEDALYAALENGGVRTQSTSERIPEPKFRIQFPPAESPRTFSIVPFHRFRSPILVLMR